MGERAQQRIPFTNQQGTGLDELAGAGREAFNVIVDSAGSVRRRPGLELWCAGGVVDGRGLDAIHATVAGDVYALSASPPNRQLYRVNESSFVEVPGIDLVGDLRVSIAETESVLALAAGNVMNKLVFADNTTTALGGSPPDASHVIANSSRLLANDTSGDKTKVYYSGPALGSSFAGFEDWSAAGTGGFFTAESRPDPVVALAERTNEVYVFGTTTVQLWGPDARLVFSPLVTREHGLGAPHSIVTDDQVLAYLDHRRRFVIGDGRDVQVISGPIQRTLDEMTTVEDCFGFRVAIGPTDVICWAFPIDGRVLTFQKGSGWGQWTGWNDQTDNFKAFPALCATHNPITNETIAGLTDGRVGVFQTGQTTDISERIMARVTTGFLNRGTDSRKHCKKVRLALRRGESSSVTGPVAFLYFRDRPGVWETPIPIDLGGSTDTEIVVEFPSLGVYRRREWRFEFAGTEDLVLTEASEEFEVLES